MRNSRRFIVRTLPAILLRLHPDAPSRRLQPTAFFSFHSSGCVGLERSRCGSRSGRSTPSVHPGGSLAGKESSRSRSILRSVSSSRASRRVSSDRLSLGVSPLMIAYWLPATCHTVQGFAVQELIGRAVKRHAFCELRLLCFEPR